MAKLVKTRGTEIARLRSELERHRSPRLEMGVIVSLTGSVGLVSSILLLQLGMLEIWIRYLAALGIAYVFFLFLMWVWLRVRLSDLADVPDISGMHGSGPGVDHLPSFSGAGGESGGAGASGSFGDTASSGSVFESGSGSGSGIGDAAGEVVGAAASADELAVPIVVIAGAILAVSVIALCAVWVIFDAPSLFAELLLDGALAGALYRRLIHLERRHWLETAIRTTALYFAATALFLVLAGWAIKAYDPTVHSVGELFTNVRAGYQKVK